MAYDTQLTPSEEAQFQAWKQQYAPNDSGFDYDLRGAFKAGLTPDAATGHWSDLFKKPNHPTFSDQSMYAKDQPSAAGHWEGDKYIPAAQPNIFSYLAGKYGLSVALSLLPLFDPNASTASQATAGASLGAQGLGLAGQLGGSPTLTALGRGAGTALGLGAAGYGAYQAATNPNFSQAQQVGHSGRAVSDAVMSALIPYYGLGKTVSVIGQQLQRSGSPQVRGLGRSADYLAEPAGAKAFWSVLQGDKSPRAAARDAPQQITLDALGPIGLVLRGLGVQLPFLSHTPTTGTTFRNEAGRIFDQIPALRGTDTSRYNMAGGVDAYNAFSPAARANAEALARLLGPLSPTYGKQAPAGQSAYQGQLANILLNRYGADLGTFGPNLLRSLQSRTAGAPA